MESDTRNTVGAALLIAALAFLVVAIIVASLSETGPAADPDDSRQVARGKTVYAGHCASCHGITLEGQPNWQARLPSGRMPAPPHDASGHTWHHPDDMLFGITKHGLVPGKYAPPRYQSDMPAFARVLSDDDIWAVLAYIKSSWAGDIRRAQREMTLQQETR